MAVLIPPEVKLKLESCPICWPEGVAVLYTCLSASGALINYKINSKQIGAAKGARIPWGQGKQGDWGRFF